MPGKSRTPWLATFKQQPQDDCYRLHLLFLIHYSAESYWVKIISLLKKSGLKASNFLRPFELVPQSLKNIRNIDKNILNNKIVQDMTANIKKSLGNTGRILIRASGTEDMIRIMVESTNQKKVNEITNKLENLIVEQDKFEKNK